MDTDQKRKLVRADETEKAACRGALHSARPYGLPDGGPGGGIDPGPGTVAEGWIDEAIDFWQAQV